MSAPTHAARAMSGLDRLVRTLHQPTHPWALACFRVAVGVSAAFEAHHNVGRLIQYTPDQWHLPYAIALPAPSIDAGVTLCEVQGVAGVLIALGVAPRSAAWVALVCQGWLFGVSQLNFRNHVYLLLLALLCVALAPSDARLSPTGALRNLWRKRRGLPRVGSAQRAFAGLAVRWIQSQIAIVYLWSGVHKLVLGFGDGYPLCVFLGRELRRGTSAKLLGHARAPEWAAALLDPSTSALSREACRSGVPSWVVAGSIATIVVELALPFALLRRRSVAWAIAVGVALHGTILWSMDVYTFGFLMVGSYALFAADPWWGAAPRARRRAESDQAGAGATSADATGAEAE